MTKNIKKLSPIYLPKSDYKIMRKILTKILQLYTGETDK